MAQNICHFSDCTCFLGCFNAAQLSLMKTSQWASVWKEITLPIHNSKSFLFSRWCKKKKKWGCCNHIETAYLRKKKKTEGQNCHQRAKNVRGEISWTEIAMYLGKKLPAGGKTPSKFVPGRVLPEGPDMGGKWHAIFSISIQLTALQKNRTAIYLQRP